MKLVTRRSALWTLAAAAALVGGVISYWASANPDGLDRAIEDHGLQPAGPAGDNAATQELQGRDAPGTHGQDAHATAEAGHGPSSPLADYQVAGVSNPFLSNALAGLFGAALVLGVMLAAGYLLARRHPAAPSPPSAPRGDGPRRSS